MLNEKNKKQKLIEHLTITVTYNTKNQETLNT